MNQNRQIASRKFNTFKEAISFIAILNREANFYFVATEKGQLTQYNFENSDYKSSHDFPYLRGKNIWKIILSRDESALFALRKGSKPFMFKFAKRDLNCIVSQELKFEEGIFELIENENIIVFRSPNVVSLLNTHSLKTVQQANI